MAKRKKKSSGRHRAQDLPNMTGPGVAPVKYKDLDKLGDQFIDIRDQKAELATEMTTIQNKIVEKMQAKNITKYQFGDQLIEIKGGKVTVKVKTVKVQSVDSSTAAERDGAGAGEEEAASDGETAKSE